MSRKKEGKVRHQESGDRLVRYWRHSTSIGACRCVTVCWSVILLGRAPRSEESDEHETTADGQYTGEGQGKQRAEQKTLRYQKETVLQGDNEGSADKMSWNRRPGTTGLCWDSSRTHWEHRPLLALMSNDAPKLINTSVWNSRAFDLKQKIY